MTYRFRLLLNLIIFLSLFSFLAYADVEVVEDIGFTPPTNLVPGGLEEEVLTFILNNTSSNTELVDSIVLEGAFGDVYDLDYVTIFKDGVFGIGGNGATGNYISGNIEFLLSPALQVPASGNKTLSVNVGVVMAPAQSNIQLDFAPTNFSLIGGNVTSGNFITTGLMDFGGAANNFELSNTSFMSPTSMNKGDIDVIVMEFEIHPSANVEVIEEIEIEVAGNVFDITQLEIYDITNGPILVSTLDFADNDVDGLDDYLDPDSGSNVINMSNGNIYLRNPPIFTSFPGSSNVYEIKISLSANAQSGNIEFGLTPNSFLVQGGNVLGGTSVFSGPIDILNGGANADLIGQWLLNEGSGTIINDSSINSNHGTLINGPVWVGGQGGNALSFDGVNDYAVIDRIAAYDNLSGFTITMWINPDIVSGTQGLFQIWPHLESDSSLGIYLNNNTVNVTVAPDGSGNLDQDLNFSSTNFMSGNWQHLAVTWDGTDIELYVDGAFSSNHSYTGNINNSAANIILGARLQNYGSNEEIPYQGAMQDVRFYNNYVDSSEVINIRDEISMTSSNIFLTDLFYGIPATLQSSDNAQGMIRFLIENDESEAQVLEGITFNFPGSTPSTDFVEAKIYSFNSAGFIATGDLASGNFIGTEVVLNDIYEVIPANGNLDLKISVKALGTNGGGNFYTELSSDNIFLSGANILANSTITDGPTQLIPDSSSNLFLSTTTFNAPASISYTGTNVQILNFKIENHGGQNERLNELIIELPQGNAQGDLAHALLGVGGGGGAVLGEVTPVSQNNIIFTGMDHSIPSSNLRLSVNVILANMPVSSNIEFLVADYNIKTAGGNVVTGSSITSGTINISSSNINNLNFISQDPFNGEVGFPASENLLITFEENIDLLSGNVEIFENGGSVEVLMTGSPNLIANANSLEIDPSYVFTPGANIHVLIDPGLVAGNISGNVFGGFASSSEWAFSIDDGSSGGNNIVFSDNVSYTAPTNMVAGSVNIEFFSFHLFNPDSVTRSVNTLEMNVVGGNALDFTDVRVIWYTGTDLMSGANRMFSHLSNGNILLDFDLNPLILTAGANYSYNILATIADPTAEANIHITMSPDDVLTDLGDQVFGTVADYGMIYLDSNASPILVGTAFTAPGNISANSSNITIMEFELDTITNGASSLVDEITFDVLSGDPINDFVYMELYDESLASIVSTMANVVAGNLVFQNLSLGLSGGSNTVLSLRGDANSSFVSDNVEFEVSPEGILLSSGNVIGSPVNSTAIALIGGGNMSGTGPILVGTLFVAPGNISAGSSNVTIMEFELDTITNGASSLVNEVTFDVLSGDPINDFVYMELYDESLASSVSTMANVVAGNLVFQNLSLGLSGGSNTVLSLRGDANSSFVSDNVEFEVTPEGIVLSSDNVSGAPVNSTAIALISGGNMSGTGPILVGTLFVAPGNISAGSSNVTIMEFELDTITNGASSLVNEVTFDVLSGDPINDFVYMELYDESLASSVSTMANVVAGNLVFQNLSLGLSGGSNTVLSLRGDANSSFVSDNVEFEVTPEGIVLNSDNVSGAPVNSTAIALVGGGNMSGTGPILVGTLFVAPGNISAGSTNVTIMEFELDTITNGASSLVNEVTFEVLSGDPLNDFVFMELYDESLASSVSAMANVVAGNLVFQNLSLGLSGGSNTVLSLRGDANSSFVSDNVEFEVTPEGIILSSDNVSGAPVNSTAILLISGGNLSDMAISFDGVDDYLHVSDNTNLQWTGDLTVEAWLYVDSAGSGIRSIVDKSDGNGFTVYVNGSDHINFFTRGGNSGSTLISNDPVPLDEWFHLAVTFDDTDDVQRIYFDGRENAWKQKNVNMNSTNGANLHIGSLVAGTNYFQGIIDEVVIWDVVLNQAEMGYPRSGSEPNLIAYYNLNEGTGTLTSDMSGYQNHATLINGPTWVASGANLELLSDFVELLGTSPFNYDANVPTSGNLFMTFSETIALTGNGILEIAEFLSGTGEVISSANMFVSGNLLEIFYENLNPGEDYNVLVSNDLIEGLTGNVFDGIADNISWVFTTAGSNVAGNVNLISTTPFNGDASFDLSGQIEMIFDQDVNYAGNGYVEFRDFNTNSVVETITSSNMFLSGNTLQLYPNNLMENETYSVEVTSGLVEGLNGEFYVGIADNVSWVFTTASSNMGSGNTSANMVSVASSSHHILFVDHGELFAMGRDDFGAIGLNGDNVQNVAIQIGNKTDWSKVAAGAEHSLGIDAGGNLFGWGSHSFDQLGGLSPIVETPSLISTGAPVIGVLGTPTNSYYIDQNNDVYGVGRNHMGQVATGSATTSESTFNLILSGVSKYSVGTEHGLAIVSGNLYAWGSNGYGQLGSNIISDYTATPVMIDDSYTWVEVEAGAFHSFAITDAGDVFAWGKNNRGQLCEPTINDSFINQMTMVSSLSGQTVKVAAGVEHTLVQMNNGSVYVGGSNDQLQAESGSEAGLVEIVSFSGADDIFAGPYSSYVTFGSNIQIIGQNVDGSVSGTPQDL